MPQGTSFTLPDDGVLIRTRRRFVGIRSLVDKLATLMVETSKRSFTMQRFGTTQWPQRYSGGKEPFINLAAAVQKWTSGGQVGPNDFARRPALIGTGRLMNSIRARKSFSPPSVTVESTAPYAKTVMEGGESEQPITKRTTKGLLDFLHSLDKRERRIWSQRLGFLFAREKHGLSLVTRQHARPFLGWTKTSEKAAIKMIEAFFRDSGVEVRER
jgi:hypothetical protein